MNKARPAPRVKTLTCFNDNARLPADSLALECPVASNTAIILLFLVSTLTTLTSWAGLGTLFTPGHSSYIVLPNNYPCSQCNDKVQDPVGVCPAKHVICRKDLLNGRGSRYSRCWVCKDKQLTLPIPVLRERQLPVYITGNNSKNLTNDDYLTLPYWWAEEHEKSLFDWELCYKFSLMFHHRDTFPTREFIDSFFAGLDQEGIAQDRDLLIVLFGIFQNRAPSVEQMRDFLHWAIWWQGKGEQKTLDQELLVGLSSLLGRQSQLPSEEQMADYINWDVWMRGTGDNKTLDRKLLLEQTSMLGYLGTLPTQEEVYEMIKYSLYDQPRSRRYYHCDKCDYVTKHREFLHIHTGAHWPAERPFQCDSCGFNTDQKSMLRQHIVVHQGLK